MITKYLIEGLDRLGKDTLIDGLQHRLGQHTVLHFGKPSLLDCYVPRDAEVTDEVRRGALRNYQERSFRNLFSLLRDAPYTQLICNRAHLGECVYAPLYRGYSGDYVLELERAFDMQLNRTTRLVLLLEDMATSRHFADDGLSLGPTEARGMEQELFIEAFERSLITDKRLVLVTGPNGRFRSKADILEDVLRP